MKRWFSVAAVVGAVVLVPVAVVAATGSGSSAVNMQDHQWTDTPVTTSSTTFTAIPALSGLAICAENGSEVAVTVSVGLVGPAAGLQVRMDGGPVVHPGAIRFDPKRKQQAFSFTFVDSVGTFEGNDTHTFDVEWRSVTGEVVTLNRGSALVQYAGGGSGGICPA